MPKIISARSCSSPGGQARTARGPCPLPQPRASPARRPALPELGQVRHHHLPEKCRYREIGHQPVENGLGGRLVEGVEGTPEGTRQLSCGRGDAIRAGGLIRIAPAGITAPSAVLTEHFSRRLGGRQAAGEMSRKPPAERPG
jgi:hypothetical protein